MLKYPITLTPDSNGTLLVDFPDIPHAHSVGTTEQEATREALDALRVALEHYFDSRISVPLPSRPRIGQATVSLPALETAKLLLWNEMLNQGLRKADLARMLDVHPPIIDRLFDLDHSTKIEFIEQVAAALGKAIDLKLAEQLQPETCR
jgi:antitoxin HicB